MRLNDDVPFWIERHGDDGFRVQRVARPARRVAFARFAIQGIPDSQNRMILPCVSLSRTHVTDAAVAMLNFLPLREALCPDAGLIEVGKALGGKLGAILGGTKQRFA